MEVIKLKVSRSKYRFHFMGSTDKMVFRYDNAPHHPEVSTHPHHKHIQGEKRPKQSREIGLRDVLSEIEEMMVR